MYCNACGKPNPDGSAFCSSCGKPLTTTPTPKPTPVQPVRPSAPPVSKPTGTVLTDFRSHFRTSWREFATAPLALALIICHSVGVLLNFIDLNTTIESLSALFGSLGSFGALSSSQTDSGNSMLTLLQILLTAPGILTAIGLWMLYMDARDQSDRPLNVTGLKLIMGVNGTLMTLFCIYVFILFCTSCSAAQELSGSSYITSAARTAVNTAMAVVVIAGGVGIALFWVTIKFIITVRDCAEECEPETKFVKGFAVFEFISGGLSVLALLSSGLTLSMAVSCALPFLFGVVLLKYKNLMETLSWEQVNYETQYVATRAPTVQSQYVPAGERVEMELKSDNWICTCGRTNRQYTSSCVCGRSRRKVLSLHGTNANDGSGWHCINCGTQNDPDAICCSKCGGTERQ